MRPVPVHVQYEDAITKIRVAARALERGASEVGPVGEVGLRHFLVAGLASSYPGLVSAEAWNAAGKTDILLQDSEGANVVVGECKSWDGPMKCLGGLDQLLGYSLRRDRGLLLVQFVRGRNFTSVLQKAESALRRHDAVVETELDSADDSVLRLRIRHPRDDSQDALVTVLFVDLPEARGEAIGGDAGRAEGLAGLLDLRDQLVATGGRDMDYVVHAVGPGQEIEPTEGTVVRAIEQRPDGSGLVIDAVANSEDARRRYGVRGAITIAPGEYGERARAILEEAVRWEIPAYVRRGAGLELEQYPPGLEEGAARLQEADALTFVLVPEVEWSWPITLHVETDRGQAQIRMDLAPVAPEPGWDVTLRGSFHNLSMSYSQRRESDKKISDNFFFRFHPTDAPVRDRLAALDFHHAVSGVGILRIESHVDAAPSTSMKLPGNEIDPSHVFDRAFFGDIVAIEDWTGRRFQLPLEASADEVAEIAKAAAAIRGSEAVVDWRGSTWRCPAPGPEVGEEGEDELPMALTASVFGEEVMLGFARGRTRYTVSEVSRLDDAEVAATLMPIDESARVVRVAGLAKPLGQDEH